MLDLRLVDCFVAVAEERSFSQAALRLGIAQPAVSIRLRRLEDILHLHLVFRTSRTVSMTPEGAGFLPHAKALLALERETLSVAQNIRRKTRETVVIGGYNFLIDERQNLIDLFVSRCPQFRIEVHLGARELHLKGVEDGTTDIFIGLAMMDQIFPQFEVTPFGNQYAHLAVPESDMLASAEILVLKDLAGRALVLSPGRQDSEIIHRLSAIIEEAGVSIVSAPESDRRSVEHFARILRAPHLIWYTSSRPRHSSGDYVVIPLSEPGMIIRRLLFSSSRNTKQSVARFIEIALESTHA